MFRDLLRVIDDVRDEMARDFERGRATGNPLTPILFWSWVLFAWFGIGCFLLYFCGGAVWLLWSITV